MSGPEIIKAARERAGLTQQAAAAAAGLAVRTVQGVEAGGMPALSTLDALASALGLSDEERAACASRAAWPVGGGR